LPLPQPPSRAQSNIRAVHQAIMDMPLVSKLLLAGTGL
jgi:hypothetical protein